MSATFGRLQGPTLELKPGLNIVQAPNEAGKSTWCAFLTAMFYGINSRERDKAGFIAEKNRYAPWSGASMSGRLDCRSGSDELTLTRTTRRQTAPLAEFQACYAGTGDPVPGLTGQTCGETLLGVSREVFERSAFIRQSGLAITQDAGLERRIASLISSGEEDTSYTEARETLKKQLTRRRYNKSGMIPGIEANCRTHSGSSPSCRAWKPSWPPPASGWRPSRPESISYRMNWPPATPGSSKARLRLWRTQKPPRKQLSRSSPSCGSGWRQTGSPKWTPSAGSGAPLSIWKPCGKTWRRPGPSGTMP